MPSRTICPRAVNEAYFVHYLEPNKKDAEKSRIKVALLESLDALYLAQEVIFFGSKDEWSNLIRCSAFRSESPRWSPRLPGIA